eukprot:5196232-Alexandrium_andersonii.AAC.2
MNRTATLALRTAAFCRKSLTACPAKSVPLPGMPPHWDSGAKRRYRSMTLLRPMPWWTLDSASDSTTSRWDLHREGSPLPFHT